MARRKNNCVSLRMGDIGYEVFLSPAHAAQVKAGDSVEFVIHMQIRDDAHELYGFQSFADLDFFRQLISVSGVGPRSALNILSLGSIGEIMGAIGRADTAYLTHVSGIGKKTAERIVVELKDKLAALADAGGQDVGFGTVASDVIDALVSMGYKKSEASEAVRDTLKASSVGKGAEELLRATLKLLAR